MSKVCLEPAKCLGLCSLCRVGSPNPFPPSSKHSPWNKIHRLCPLPIGHILNMLGAMFRFCPTSIKTMPLTTWMGSSLEMQVPDQPVMSSLLCPNSLVLVLACIDLSFNPITLKQWLPSFAGLGTTVICCRQCHALLSLPI